MWTNRSQPLIMKNFKTPNAQLVSECKVFPVLGLYKLNKLQSTCTNRCFMVNQAYGLCKLFIHCMILHQCWYNPQVLHNHGQVFIKLCTYYYCVWKGIVMMIKLVCSSFNTSDSAEQYIEIPKRFSEQYIEIPKRFSRWFKCINIGKCRPCILY